MRQRKDNNAASSSKKTTSYRQSKLAFLSQQKEQAVNTPSSPRRRAVGKPKRYLNEDFVNEFPQPNKRRRQEPAEDTSNAIESLDHSASVDVVIDSSLPDNIASSVFENVASQNFVLNTVVSTVGTSVTLPQSSLNSSSMPDNTINISLPVVGNEILDGQGIPLAGVSVVEVSGFFGSNLKLMSKVEETLMHCQGFRKMV